MLSKQEQTKRCKLFRKLKKDPDSVITKDHTVSMKCSAWGDQIHLSFSAIDADERGIRYLWGPGEDNNVKGSRYLIAAQCIEEMLAAPYSRIEVWDNNIIRWMREGLRIK